MSIIKRLFCFRQCICVSLVVGSFASIAYGNAEPEKKEEHGAAKEEHGAPASAAGHGGGHGEKEPEKDVTPLPRRIAGPKLSFEDVDGEGPSTFDYKRYHYTLVTVFGTWNKRSAEFVKLINPYIPEFKKRNIFVLALFTHDTKTTIRDWRKVTNADFKLGLASIQFIDALKNPKVPTFWLVNNLGNTLYYGELPRSDEVEGVLKNLLRWTDF